MTKLYAAGVGVRTLDYRLLNKRAPRKIDLPLPVIVKPLRLGSSIGVAVVREEQELDYALDVAFEFDEDVLIEPFINGVREFNLAGCKVGDEFCFSIIEEPIKNDFLDFDKKYRDFGRSSRANEAQIDEGLAGQLRKSFKKIYDGVFEGALIRCDFFVIDREVFLNEINPIPGSMAHYLFDDFPTVLEGLSRSLPSKRKISVNYKYIHDIHSAKGKA
jgi:D-alanine-D-alanine ligase